MLCNPYNTNGSTNDKNKFFLSQILSRKYLIIVRNVYRYVIQHYFAFINSAFYIKKIKNLEMIMPFNHTSQDFKEDHQNHH